MNLPVDSLTAGLSVRPDDILAKSLELLKETEPLELSLLHGYSTLLFAGSPFGGKTTLLDRFSSMVNSDKTNDTSSTYQETIGLEYRCLEAPADVSADSLLTSKVVNLWELGNGTLFTPLLRFPLTRKSLLHASVILVIDLTRPSEMSALLKTLLGKLESHIRGNLLGSDAQLKATLLQETQARVVPNGGAPAPRLFPVPLVLLGTKYDTFQNLDPEVKKQVVRYLRAVAVTYGAALLFVSSKSETLLKRVHACLGGLAFERANQMAAAGGEVTPGATSSNKPTVSSSPGKPVHLPFGYDTLSRIGVAGLSEAEATFESLFPQVSMDSGGGGALLTKDGLPNGDPRNDPNFAEPELDKVLEYKYMLLN